MKSKIFTIAAMLLLVAGSFYTCQKNENNNELPDLTRSEGQDDGKTVLKVFKDEPGFIRGITSPHIDRLNFYFFEPVTPCDEFTYRLYLTNGSLHDINLYVNKFVKINGHVIDNMYLIEEFDSDCECLVTRKYNVLELSSIKLEDK